MSNTVKLPTCPKCQAPIPAEAPQGLCPKCVLLGAATATEQGVPATATSEIPSIERISKAFPQLEVLELIGRGGMGFVFKARQPHLDRFVALKLLPDKLAKDPQFAERFNREGRVLAKLNHPNIVSVYDFGQAGGFYYLAMEYVDGVNLRQAMRAGRFSPAEALSIVPKVCEALQYAHEQGILHRDIKPENILLDAKGRVKIADFGIAKLVGEDQPNITLTNTGAALGTPHYMAPEQLEKPATVDHRADIYSLGVVFYEMLTGELPIGRFAAPSAKTPVNTTVDDVVFRTLEKDRERRFQSAGEMRTQVEHLGEGANAIPTQTDSAEAGKSRKDRISEWSIYGALSVGLSLPGPLTILAALLGGRSVLTGRSGVGTSELWLALGSVALPGLGGTLLGWLALNEIRESRGRVKGLPLAMFATLFWPLTIFGALTIGVPMFWIVPGRDSTIIGRFLVMLLPAAVIAFGFWTIHATARWASQQQGVQQRGLLKWVFMLVLISGMGALLIYDFGMGKRAWVDDFAQWAVSGNAGTSTSAGQPGDEPGHCLRVTFRGGELATNALGLWLALNYYEESYGGCEKYWKSSVIGLDGFATQTVETELPKDGNNHFESPSSRVMFRLPDGFDREANAGELRRFKAFRNTTIKAFPGVEYDVFNFRIGERGSIKVVMGIRSTDATANGAAGIAQAGVPDSANEQHKLGPHVPNFENNLGRPTELWSPKLAPGEKPRPSEILQEAHRFTGEGRYEEALQRHIWFHNHALEFEPSQVGVRLSFALSYWTELAQRYPKAKEALNEISNRGTQAFANGEGYFDLFMEVSSINSQLGRRKETLVLFDSIQSQDPKLARQCYGVVEDLLVENGDYALCESFIPDFQKRFETLRSAWQRTLSDRNLDANRNSLREHAEQTFINSTRKLVEILVGVSRNTEAGTIRDLAVALLDVPELRSALTDAEKKVASHSVVPKNP